MIRFQGKSFDIEEKCKRCLTSNEIQKLKGGGYHYYCDCFPININKILPIVKIVDQTYNELIEVKDE